MKKETCPSCGEEQQGETNSDGLCFCVNGNCRVFQFYRFSHGDEK